VLLVVVFFRKFAQFSFVTLACSGPSIQRAPPLSASQNPQLSIGKPYRPGGVQRLDILNRMACFYSFSLSVLCV